MVENFNSLKIDGAKIAANVAKYDKNKNRIVSVSNDLNLCNINFMELCKKELGAELCQLESRKMCLVKDRYQINGAILEWVWEWKRAVPIKVNFLGWRAVLNRLPSKRGLANRGVQLPSTACVLCGDADESELHLFLHCSWATEVWASIATWCELNRLIKFLLSPIKKVANAIVLAAIWFIWKARNDIIFNNKVALSSRVVEEVKSNSFMWVKNRGKAHITWDNWSRFPFAVH
ncbi:hypothetical protein LXL04_021992 [Taraxacum kok-saghyz]